MGRHIARLQQVPRVCVSSHAYISPALLSACLPTILLQEQRRCFNIASLSSHACLDAA